MTHSGPSRACASFAPPMSVRIFGHFEQFSTFSARRAPCSAPSCTPDAWTNGLYMTWVLCLLVNMVRTRCGQSGATFVKVLAQSECGQFCHFGNCGPDLDCHHAEWHEYFWVPSAWDSSSDSQWIAYGTADPISKPAWRYTFEGTPDFGSFCAAKMTPFWDLNFTPPRGQLAAPVSLCPFQVVHSDIGLRSCLLSCEPLALPWPGEPRVGMTPILVILAS